MKGSFVTLPFEGFSKLKFEERQKRLQEFASLSQEDLDTLIGSGQGGANQGLSLDQAEFLIENVIGLFSMPIGLATHFLIDGEEMAIPMVVEETSIVAAASSAAKWVHHNGGFKTRALGKLIIGQIQFPSVRDIHNFSAKISEHTDHLIRLANEVVPGLVSRGGGIVGLQIRKLDRPYAHPETGDQEMAVIHVLCDPCDAMGANLINQVCEALKGPLEEITGEKIGLCILSNLVDTKLVEATCEIATIPPELGKRIVEAWVFANTDPYRGATHNKGVMNGIDPVLIATGNDWRAVEAGIHAYAARNNRYQPITEWSYSDGKLRGKFLAPLAVGTVGGVTHIHPTARVCLKILGVRHSEELARVCAATGLAANLAALRALCSEGIVQGHMRLHATNLALAAGASKSEVPFVRERLRKEKRITFSRAQEVLRQIRLEP